MNTKKLIIKKNDFFLLKQEVNNKKTEIKIKMNFNYKK